MGLAIKIPVSMAMSHIRMTETKVVFGAIGMAQFLGFLPSVLETD